MNTSETKPYQFKVGDEGELVVGSKYCVLALTTINGDDRIVARLTGSETGQQWVATLASSV